MASSITIVDYGTGNVGSVFNMLRHLGFDATITAEHEMLRHADRIILSGVGAFDAAVEQLRSRDLVDVLTRRVIGAGVPLLGICLGMQLLTERSDEGTLPGLGWLPAETIRLTSPDPMRRLRIPHMGWNEITVCRDSPLVNGLSGDARFYFVHSFHVMCRERSDVVATTSYGGTLCAVVQHDNICGTQFHPEKSHRFGMTVLRNFVEGVF